MNKAFKIIEIQSCKDRHSLRGIELAYMKAILKINKEKNVSIDFKTKAI